MESARVWRRFGFPVVVALLAGLGRAQDTVTFVGRALDRDGKPVAGCAVGAFAWNAEQDVRELLAQPQTTTDAEGRFRLTAAKDVAELVIAAKGYQTHVSGRQVHGGTGEEHQLDAMMLPGATLRGRVRDAMGKPIAGARVAVRDAVGENLWNAPHFEARVRTDARGIFEAPGVPASGLRVTVTAPGFASLARLAAQDSPLDVTLAATGLVRGRVVGADGAPVVGANVSVVTVEAAEDPAVRSGADGRFELTAPRAERFRVEANEGKAPWRKFTSGLLRGAADDVVVTTDVAGASGRYRVKVRCVDAATKQPIQAFQASWSSLGLAALVNVAMAHPASRRAFTNEAEFDVQADLGDRGLGTILVEAPGHGFGFVAVPENPKDTLVVELPAECCMVGTVVDSATGKPMPGAAVRALPKAQIYGGSPDPWVAGVVTDADGRFRIGGLCAGEYDVQAYGRNRPATTSQRVTVEPGTDARLDFTVPPERYLAFELEGDVPTTSFATLEFVNAWTSSGEGGAMLQAPISAPRAVPLAGQRRHRLGPVGNGEFTARLTLPTRDRLGSRLVLTLGEVKTDTKLQLPDLQQYLHHGRVVLPDSVPSERVAVVLKRVRGRREAMFDFGTELIVGIGSDGAFQLDVVPGSYDLMVKDIETGIVFHREPKPLRLGSDTIANTIELRPEVHWLEIELAPEQDGGEVVLGHVAVARKDGQDNGGGLGYRVGTKSLRCLVGEGVWKVEAWRTFQMLSPISNGWQQKVCAAVEAEVTGAETRVSLKVPPPPTDAEILRGAPK